MKNLVHQILKDTNSQFRLAAHFDQFVNKSSGALITSTGTTNHCTQYRNILGIDLRQCFPR